MKTGGPLDQATTRLRGDVMGKVELVYSLSICISGFTYTIRRLLVAVKNGPFHIEISDVQMSREQVSAF